MCFDRFITILLQKSLKLSAMIWGSLVLTLEMLETEYSGFVSLFKFSVVIMECVVVLIGVTVEI